MNKNIKFFLLAAALNLFVTQQAFAEGSKIKEKAIFFGLSTNKEIYHEGESIQVRCSITNNSSKSISIQTRVPFANLSFTVRVPGGCQFLYMPDVFKKIGTITKDDYTSIKPGESLELFSIPVIAGEICQSEIFWQCAMCRDICPLPFKSEGSYMLKFEYIDTQPKVKDALRIFYSEGVTIEINKT